VLSVRAEVTCPTCGAVAHLRYDPETEKDAPARALKQMVDECPEHLSHAREIFR
jgi:hypothetical protein